MLVRLNLYMISHRNWNDERRPKQRLEASQTEAGGEPTTSTPWFRPLPMDHNDWLNTQTVIPIIHGRLLSTPQG